MALDVKGIAAAYHVHGDDTWCMNDLPDLVPNFAALSAREQRRKLETKVLEGGRSRLELFLSRNEVPRLVRSSVEELLLGIQNEIERRAEQGEV